MGLKTTNFEIDTIGVTIPTAYARITSLNVNTNGNAFAEFTIQTDRDSIDTKRAVETRTLYHAVDKNEPIYTQLYTAAKEELFNGWEDDIVDE